MMNSKINTKTMDVTLSSTLTLAPCDMSSLDALTCPNNVDRCNGVCFSCKASIDKQRIIQIAMFADSVSL